MGEVGKVAVFAKGRENKPPRQKISGGKAFDKKAAALKISENLKGDKN